MISIPLPISKGGTGAAASGENAIAIGSNAQASGDGSIAIGTEYENSSINGIAIGNNTTVGDYGIAIGVASQAEEGSAIGDFCYANGTRSSAIGHQVTNNTDNSLEVGYWQNSDGRSGGVKINYSGQVSITSPERIEPFTASTAANGSEGMGTLADGMFSVRRYGDGIFLDLNNAGTILTKNIASIYGQCYQETSGEVTIASSGVYQSTGLEATIDLVGGMELGTSDLFALKNISGSTRVFSVHAGMHASSGNNNIIGVKLYKNGSPLNGSECRASTTSTGFTTISTEWIVSLGNDEEIALYVANHTGTTAITILRGKVIATSAD
jgi:hypothetical protein